MLNIPKISFSLLALSKDEFNDDEFITKIGSKGIAMWHYDISRETKSLLVDDIYRIKKISSIPIDVHLAVDNPIDFIERLKLDKTDYFCLHVENKLNIELLKKIKTGLGCKFGLAINVETDIEEIVYAKSILDYLLIMASTPGVSGGAFNEIVINKIEWLKKEFPYLQIHVDGGINNLSASVLRENGVDVLISGSYIVKDDYLKQISKLIGRNLFIPVNQIMYSNQFLPIISEDSLLTDVAREIDEKRIGCTCVKNILGEFVGLITDTDIRKFLINNPNIFGIKAKDVMNKIPFVVDSSFSAIDLIRLLEENKKFYTVVPVVHKEKCVGVVRLQDVLFNDFETIHIRQTLKN